MKLKRLLGWFLFACGVIGGFFVFNSSINHILLFIDSLIDLLTDTKTWILVPSGISVWWGWELSHKDIKEKMTTKTAKWAAGSIIDEFGVVQLKGGIDKHRLVEVWKAREFRK